MIKNDAAQSELPGTYVFTGELSQKGYHFNKMCHSLRRPENREAYKRDEKAYLAKFDLTDWEIQKTVERDWLSLIKEGGASIYLLLKLAAVLGIDLAALGAQQRGESREEFLKTRNVPGAT